ncbi:MAG: hypothetical protein IJ452_00275 [Butyricicoccus sp.]|nr:hypothetical protein [Butyricicoccus sp.]MBQ8584701.1 hypothetical protein [Butyricicoccus sp.]
MKELLETTKVKVILLCLALIASFALGYSINNPGSEFYRNIAVDRIEESMLQEVRMIGLRLISCQKALERGEEPDPFIYQELRITSGAMIARIYDAYGDPEYDRPSLNYLFGMAHYINKIALENLTIEEWNTLFSDAEAVVKIYGMDLEDPDLLLDELDKLLEGRIFPAKFLTSYTILGNAEVDPF